MPNRIDRKQPVLEILKFAIIALVIIVPIRLFVAQPFIVKGDSMVPTFENKDYLIVDQISYRFNEPRRGDVIIFRYPNNPSRFFIKRIIGLPGEEVIIEGGSVRIINEDHPTGFILNEPYINDALFGQQSTDIGEDEYFVMGDNRPASSDSRVWGPLHEDYIVGRALIRLFPKMKGHPGDFRGDYDGEFPEEPETDEEA